MQQQVRIRCRIGSVGRRRGLNEAMLHVRELSIPIRCERAATGLGHEHLRVNPVPPFLYGLEVVSV